jgi:hypothetical protein
MIQIDFTSAFGSVPHGLIAHNMASLGLPPAQIETVMKIYEGASTRIVVPTGTSEPIEWKSGTVQRCPLYPTLFNICLEPFLRLMEKPEWKSLGFAVSDTLGSAITQTNTAAYADDLILYATTRDGAQKMPDALADFCLYSGLTVNGKKCVSVSITWNGGIREDAYASSLMRKGRCLMNERCLPIPEEVSRCCVWEEIEVNEASIYLGLPIGTNKEECSTHGAKVLESMKVNISRLAASNLNIKQKLEGVKFMELPRIDYRMMCADIREHGLNSFDRWLRGTVQAWLKTRGIPVGMPGISWRDGGVTLPSLRERQSTMIIRSICDIMTSKDPEILNMMDYIEQEQAQEWNIGIRDRENPQDKKGFLRWYGKNPDWRQVKIARMHSIFPRAFKAVEESDISLFVKDGKAHLHDETAAEGYTPSRFPRPAMWITQSVMRKNHFDAFRSKPLCSKGTISRITRLPIIF